MKYKYLQEGGQLPAEEQNAAQGAAAPEAGGAEEAMAQVAQELVQQLMQAVGDPQAVAAILQMALEMVAGASQEQPTFQRNGGKVVRLK